MADNTPTPEYSLSGDQSLTHPDDDVLGYSDFARHLANAILKMVPDNGIVMALYGTWGTGKSSVLNFVQHYLNEDEQNAPVIYPFNPWWFSDEEDLVRQFLSQLSKALTGKNFEPLKEKLANLAIFTSKIPLIPGIEAVEQIGKWLNEQDNLFVLKQKIHELLKDSNQKILVIIDDIDRLPASQMRQMFRVVKSIANFPNVIYLLAFDRHVVASSIEDGQTTISGQDYLEKIIQVPFELPLPSQASVQSMFFKKLNEILAYENLDENSFDKTYWANVYHEGISGFIKTPRNVMQLTNALSVTYPAVHCEVNPVDFIAIETLRVFSPETYDMVRNMPQEFTGIYSPKSSYSDVKSPLDPWFKIIPDNQLAQAKKLLRHIFPKFNGGDYGAEWKSEWRKNRMIRSEDVFPVYFRFAIPEGEIGHLELKSYLGRLGDEKEFKKLLTELSKQHIPDGTTRARRFLTLLEDFTENEISQEHIPVIYKVFYDSGEILYLGEDIPHGFLSGFNNRFKISRILYQLGERLNQEERFNLIKRCVEKGDSLEIIVQEVSLIGDKHKESRRGEPPPSEKDRQFNSKQLKSLEQLALERIRRAARDDTLIEKKECDYILYRWKEWTEHPGEITDWVNKNLQNDIFLIKLISSFVSEGISQEMDSPIVERTKKFGMNGFKEFVNPDEVIDRVRNLANNNDFEPEQRNALHLFLRKFKKEVN